MSTFSKTNFSCSHLLPVNGCLNLDVTLNSGQCFDWRTPFPGSGVWHGRVDLIPVQVSVVPVQDASSLNESNISQALKVESDILLNDELQNQLVHYFQLNFDPASIIQHFPADPGLELAVNSCPGLRLLRQPPWECLAGFILSSTKRIDQIQELVKRLSVHYGPSLRLSSSAEVSASKAERWLISHAFPSPERLAEVSEAGLRDLGLGFRAPYLKAAAEIVASHPDTLSSLGELSYPEAKEWLMQIPGVGSKIADCVALFAFGFQEAFPLDVWMQKILRWLYFKNRKVSLKRLEQFHKKKFAPWGGYIQQFLFHAARTGVFPMK